jgi:hypothetical protein
MALLGAGTALVIHVAPAGLLVGVLAYFSRGRPDGFLEGGFLWAMTLLVLETVLAIACLGAAAVAFGRGSRDVAGGLFVGWVAGLVIVPIIGCLAAAAGAG